MKTDTQYLEPVGFKGSPGQWETSTLDQYHPTEFSIQSDKGWHIAKLNPYSPEQDNTEANAQLISQSKELAKALQQLLNCDYTSGTHLYEAQQNAKQVLKDAGLTDK